MNGERAIEARGSEPEIVVGDQSHIDPPRANRASVPATGCSDHHLLSAGIRSRVGSVKTAAA